MTTVSKFYITTPIYYVNDVPHIGHVYTTTIADIVARHHRLRGDEVFFLTGTDEHAAKVVESAAEHGMTTVQWADQNARAFQETFAKLGITNDDFIRTSQPRHKEKVQQYVGELLQSGDLYPGEYEGWYDAGQEEYVSEGKAKESEYKSPISGRPLVRKKEKNYFFRLSKYGDALLKLLEERPKFVQPDARRNEVIGRIREGLNDVPISRTGAGDWGIKVPGDSEHVIYVWIDALFNYLSTVDTSERRGLWPANVHLIAKDILWFHAVIWPAMLLALKRELPGQVYAHSFWISEGQKMSKSMGNFVDLAKIDRYVRTFGLDAFRYFLASNGPLGTTDSDFAEAKFIEVYNTDLANDLGNLLFRTLTMIEKFCGGSIQVAADVDGGLAEHAESLSRVVDEAMSELQLSRALDAIWDFVQRSNKYIEDSKPWAVAKVDAAKVGGILYSLAEADRVVSVLISPFMPATAERIQRQLGVFDGAPELRTSARWGLLRPGTKVTKGQPLFPRYDVSSGPKVR
ncbi:MAG: methionine--tRNA ligase [Planctomycetes bacterium]|nr:methionine--tRNA ligase [Planctomycetota bacterium]